jgi:hypothetical protein
VRSGANAVDAAGAGAANRSGSQAGCARGAAWRWNRAYGLAGVSAPIGGGCACSPALSGDWGSSVVRPPTGVRAGFVDRQAA